MSNIVEADYTIEYERTLPVIISEIKIIEQNTARVVLENGIQIGQRLQEAKEKVGHGGFGEWCRENLNYSQDTAQKFMRLAKEYGGENSLLANTAMSRNFSISNALSLLKLPEEDREKFVEEHPVEDMTNKALEEEIQKLKRDKEQNIITINDLNEEIKKTKERTGQALHEAEELKRRLQDAEAKAAADPKELMDLRRKVMEAEDKAEAAAADLEKAREKEAKAKEKLKKEKDDRQKEIDAAIEKERQGIIDKVNEEAADRMQKITGENDDLRQQLAETQRKLETASKGTVVQFKILTDQLQDIFDKCGTMVIEEADEELSEKMNNALKQIVKAFGEAL